MKKRQHAGEPQWYKDAIIYELHVKAFADSNNDGIGDLRGLIGKLDYLASLGVTAVWLLPFYPSPGLDDGYDIADYYNINHDYGTLSDFRRFLREAHKRGIRVITELVVNHTSDQHRWFQRSRRAQPGSKWRDFYVWSDTTERYRDARIIFTDFESSNWSWDPVAQAYYWHRFYHHQPDLNYDSVHVRREILRVIDFWMDMGVDGMRLDAVPYLIEREGTNCENLPETHTVLKEIRAHLDARYTGRMLLAEANQWPEDAAAYFGAGDECHMAFHFPVMPRLFMALRTEDRFPVIDILEQSWDIPEGCQWAMFLRNHDELTLEMVTDEERDYMYRAYAQDPRARINVGIRRRLAPLLDNDRRAIELLTSLLFSLPGTPVLYYGDELGMGDNYYLGDRDGVRTPMQWSPDRNAGFSQVNPHQLYLPVVIDPAYHYSTVNVETQERNTGSLLWFVRRLAATRGRFKAFGRGKMKFIGADNPRVLTFVREHQDETMFVAANLSDQCQVAHVALQDYLGYGVEDAFSGNKFPPITQDSYPLTMSPRSFFWFVLRPAEAQAVLPPEEVPTTITAKRWQELRAEDFEDTLSRPLTRYLKRCRWFGGKGRAIRRLSVHDQIQLRWQDEIYHVVLLEVTYVSGPRELYLLPLAFAGRERQLAIMDEAPHAVIAYLQTRTGSGVLYEAVYSEGFRSELLGLVAQGRSRKGGQGRFIARRGNAFRDLLDDKVLPLPSRVMQAEQSNTSLVYDDTLFLKLYRRIEEGINPDVEISQYLTEQTSFRNLPAYGGSLDWQRDRRPAVNVGILLKFVPNEGDAWKYTLNYVERSISTILAMTGDSVPRPPLPESLLEVRQAELPDIVQEFVGPFYLEMTRLLGQRTAEMHAALAEAREDPELAAEPFSLLYQKALHQSVRGHMLKVFEQLRESIETLPTEVREPAERVLAARRPILGQLRRLTTRKIPAMKMRTHGDFHLGQVLYTGKDFVIIDFEGEPARPLSGRRLKQCALRDVAGMIRSYHYATYAASRGRINDPGVDQARLRYWMELWYRTVAGVYLESYRQSANGAAFIPDNEEDFTVLLETFLIEKAVYEVGYELNNRPTWLDIPIRGILQLLGRAEES